MPSRRRDEGETKRDQILKIINPESNQKYIIWVKTKCKISFAHQRYYMQSKMGENSSGNEGGRGGMAKYYILHFTPVQGQFEIYLNFVLPEALGQDPHSQNTLLPLWTGHFTGPTYAHGGKNCHHLE